MIDLAPAIQKMLSDAGDELVSIDPKEPAMTIFIKFLQAEGRVSDLDRRLQKVYDQTKEPACVYDVWTEQFDGGQVAFGFLNYLSPDADDRLEHRSEILLSRDAQKVREACDTGTEWIWMPRQLLASREDWNRDPGLVTRLA